MNKLSIIIPAKNEEKGLGKLSVLKDLYPEAEIIVVNDGSTDRTKEIAVPWAKVIDHPYSKGNGASIKTGARAATGDILVFMDGDGQHQPEDVGKLLAKMAEGYDLVVGARSRGSQASKGRWLANTFYNKFSSWMVDKEIKDLTSGFRIVRASFFKEILHLLPNGFSYPTTSTMAFFRYGYSVSYVDINVKDRIGKSHINLLKDGVRFLLIIFKVGTLYSPLKLFTPISFLFFLLGTFRYIFTYLDSGAFTNMSALMYSTAMIIFLIGLVSEQVTMLIYTKHES